MAALGLTSGPHKGLLPPGAALGAVKVKQVSTLILCANVQGRARNPGGASGQNTEQHRSSSVDSCLRLRVRTGGVGGGGQGKAHCPLPQPTTFHSDSRASIAAE